MRDVRLALAEHASNALQRLQQPSLERGAGDVAGVIVVVSNDFGHPVCWLVGWEITSEVWLLARKCHLEKPASAQVQVSISKRQERMS